VDADTCGSSVIISGKLDSSFCAKSA